jgi:hypothetical protein
LCGARDSDGWLLWDDACRVGLNKVVDRIASSRNLNEEVCSAAHLKMSRMSLHTVPVEGFEIVAGNRTVFLTLVVMGRERACGLK